MNTRDTAGEGKGGKGGTLRAHYTTGMYVYITFTHILEVTQRTPNFVQVVYVVKCRFREKQSSFWCWRGNPGLGVS